MAKFPDVEDRAPDFTLPSTAGEITLSKRLEASAVLLVFYPGDETSVCTKQLCDYQGNLSVFAGLGIDVLAVNPQGLDSHRKFADKYGLSFPLLADTDKSVCRSYGALGLLGMAKRALVVIGRDGIIKWRRTDFPFLRRTASELREVISSLGLSQAQ
ncbi:MAG: peroxiredoxin [Planctomycetes bacterium]|nr:peroxiredoxin [Planctomycetota bacterium]